MTIPAVLIPKMKYFIIRFMYYNLHTQTKKANLTQVSLKHIHKSFRF